MAGEYDLNLSNGSVFAAIHPLETNGPGNVSTPRFIQEARPTFGITLAVPGGPSLSVVGDFTSLFVTGFQFEVVGSTGNDGTYTVVSSSFGGGNTTIVVGSVASAVADGDIIAHAFKLAGDMSTRLDTISATDVVVSESHGPLITGANTSLNQLNVGGDYSWYFTVGVTFNVINSTGNDGAYTTISSSFDGTDTIISVGSVTDATVDGQIDGLINGTYTIDAIGSTYDATADVTWVPVGNGNIRDQIITPLGLPLGEISYTSLDPVTSLQLPGKGTMHYGEKLIENMVRMVENFASDDAPDANTVLGVSPSATPLIGQQWYNTTAGEEGFKTWTGAAWTSDVDLDTGAIILRDLESASTTDDIYITASETNLPVGYTGTDEPGLVIWQEVNPTAGEPVFRVLESNGTEALRVEYSGYTVTENNLEIKGTGDSFVYGNLSIGNMAVAPTHMLEVSGTGYFGNLVETTPGYYTALFATATTALASDNYIPNVEYMEAPMRAEKEPTGVANRADSVLSFVNGTNTFTIAPAVTSWDYWIHGAKYTLSAAKNLVMSTTEGLHFIYIDNTETLQEVSVFDPSILLANNVYLCCIYWDATNNQAIYVADERHGLTMDADTHAHFHLTFGCQFVSGLGLSNMDSENGTPTDASSKFDVGNGIIRDEDIQHNIVDGSPQTLTTDAEVPVFYRSGASANWRRKAADTFPYIYSGSAGYTGGSGLPAYNLNTAGTWSLTEVTNGRYFLMHFLATNDVNHPIVGICGINEYNNANDAYDGANGELSTLAGLPFEEFTPIATVMYQVSTGYTGTTNLIRQRDVEISPGVFAEYVDWRDVNTFTSVIGGGGITDHGNLSGLTDDDHLQYMNLSGVRAMTGDLVLANSTPSNDLHATSMKYVDDTIANISWREPVRVQDTSVYANSAAFPVGGVVDGVTLAVDDRVLFSNTTLLTDRDVFIWSGSAWSKEAANPQTVGDTVYVREGSYAGRLYSLNNASGWDAIGLGSGINVQLETQTAGPGQLIFNLATARYSVGTNRLQVFVDGVKQFITLAYTETDPATVTFVGPSPFVGGEIVEFIAYDEQTLNSVAKREQQTGLTGTPVITFASVTYQLGSDNLLVFVNGQKMIKAIDYNETSDSSITWIGTALVATDVLEFYVSVPIVAGTKLRDTDDVSTAVPNNGDTLIWNASSGLWEPGSAAGSAGVGFDYITGTVGTVVATTNVTTTAKTGTHSFQQVFKNGVLQREDVTGFPATGNYFVSGANQITMAVALVATDEILVYTL